MPFAIHGGFEAWPQVRKLPSFRKVILEFGEPLPASEITVTPAENRAKVVRALEYSVMALKASLDRPALAYPAFIPISRPMSGDWIES